LFIALYGECLHLPPLLPVPIVGNLLAKAVSILAEIIFSNFFICYSEKSTAVATDVYRSVVLYDSIGDYYGSTIFLSV